MITFDKQAWHFFRRWTWLKWRARNATLKHALRAMLWLNRAAAVAADGSYRTKTYALKTDLLRYLYASGLVDAVTKQQQTQICWTCGGDGDDPWYDDVCRKCNGTGIYRENILLKFRVVGGYVWHQPAPLVDWLNADKVEWDDQPTFEGQHSWTRFYSAKLREHWFAVVVMYLWRHGVDTRKHQLAPLRACLKWPGWWYRLRKVWKQRRIAKERETIPEIPF